jgi:hypothetical protein
MEEKEQKRGGNDREATMFFLYHVSSRIGEMTVALTFGLHLA